MQYTNMSQEALNKELENVKKEYEDIKALNLSLNMARGKPETNQLDLSLDLLDAIKKEDLVKHYDYMNYGGLDGIDEMKDLFGELLHATHDQLIIYGNSSLNIMFDQISRGYSHGYLGNTPWCKEDKVKFLCPAPGYDRHFAITERFNIEMITIPLNDNGPDVEMIKEYVKDPSVKGMWCVPQYANPTGITYSDEVVKALASLSPAAKDFRLFWDNAYIIHHLYDDKQDHVLDILKACKDAGNEDMVFEFTSTSKVTFPGSGVSCIATSENNKKDILKHMTIQTIGHDKINQYRHAVYFKDLNGLLNHMKKHADILRPKFIAVDEILTQELGDLDICEWTKPLGGYFISFTSMKGCAKKIVGYCKDAGVILTGAGATYPYGKDPNDNNIRIAPSFPPLDELKQAAKVFTVCVKLATLETLLNK